MSSTPAIEIGPRVNLFQGIYHSCHERTINGTRYRFVYGKGFSDPRRYIEVLKDNQKLDIWDTAHYFGEAE